MINRSGVSGCIRDSDLSADFLNFGAYDFPSKNPFKKCFEMFFFLLWRRDPVLELQFLSKSLSV